MGGTEVLAQLETLGICVTLDGDDVVMRPGSQVPEDLLAKGRHSKPSIVEILASISGTCSCDPLPSQAEFGALAQAGCGPAHEQCEICKYTWVCKICLGCRRCRSPG